MGEEVDWVEVGEGASAPYDGYIDCIVREALTVGINSLVEDRAIVVKRNEEP